MKKTEAREPILLSDESGKHEEYLRRIRSLQKETAKFKIVFDEIIGVNLNIPFTKEWLASIKEGTFEDKVSDERVKFLATQPKLIHPSINQEFSRLAAPLYPATYSLKQIFDALPYESQLMGRAFPSELADFNDLPIDRDCNFNLSDEWQATVKKSFEVWVSTDQEFEKYDLLQDLLSLKKKFKDVHQANAPYIWQVLIQNFNEIGTELTIRAVK